MSTTKPRTTQSVSVGFSIPKAERSRLDHLVKVFSDGNRSAFLRMAMDRMVLTIRETGRGRSETIR